MKILAKQDRELIMINAQNTQNENDAEKIILKVPEQYEDFNKKIVFVTPDGNVWDIITNNEYLIPKAITKYKQVDLYIWLTKGDVDFRSQTRTLKFYQNVDASNEITDEEIGRVNTVINLLEEEITKVENLDITSERVSDGVEITFTDKDGETTVRKVNDGITPTATVVKSGDTATITITDKDGTTTAQITDGTDGTDGVDGFSPVANVEKVGKTATITITDRFGTTTSSISDGNDGKDGFSPSATITQTQDGARIDITDKNGTTTANIYNGDDYVITQQDYETIADIVETDISPILETKADKTEIPTKTSDLTNDSNFAKTNQNNNFSTAQTVNGTLTVNGDIVQSGQSYETHAEQLFTKNDLIKTRDGAVGGLASNEVTGIEAINYDGANNGRLVFDASGTARVGDVGDEVALLARDESSNMTDGKLLTWDASNLEAKTIIGMATLTQAEYDALTIKDTNTYYYISEE